MLKRKQTTLLIGVFSLVLSLITLHFFKNISCVIENSFSFTNYLFQNKKVPDVIAVEIDDYSLKNIPYKWPWERSVYKQVIENLTQRGTKVIAVDIVFKGTSKSDSDLEATLKKNKNVVLAYYLDDQGNPVFPEEKFRENAVIGFINTPADPTDGKTRKIWPYLHISNFSDYHFSVKMAALYLNKNPEKLVQGIPLDKHKRFFLNYLIKPKDVKRVSFYDVYKGNIKKEDFSEKVVIIFPQAKILKDYVNTPLGEMPGGYIHINSFFNIVNKLYLKPLDYKFTFSILFILLVILAFIFSSFGPFISLGCVIGILFIISCTEVVLNLVRFKSNSSLPIFFCFTYFITHNIYRYIYFSLQLLHIKDRATKDPLTGLYTLRYFWYHLNWEAKEIYSPKLLVFLKIEGLEESIQDLDISSLKKLWENIRNFLVSYGSFWSQHAPGEIVGFAKIRVKEAHSILEGAKNDLQSRLLYFLKKPLKVKIIYMEATKIRKAREDVYNIFKKLSTLGEEIVYFNLPLSKTGKKKDTFEFKESLQILEEDIEERNRRLLKLINELKKKEKKLQNIFLNIMSSLVNALEEKDPYTRGHSQRVCEYALMIGEKCGFSKQRLNNLKNAALLHDIGKFGIPDSILHKKGRLSEEEFEFVKRHPIQGVRILQPIEEFREFLPFILYHHERYNGKGYPYGLIGDAIPEEAQIIAISDVFDALTSGRPYRASLSFLEAIEEIEKGKGKEFNPTLVDLFKQVLKEKNIISNSL